MTESELIAMAGMEIDKAQDYVRFSIAGDRADSYDYYWGKPFGNEIEGRSAVMSHDVQQVIDSLLPNLIKTFIGSDSAVEFSPRRQEDVDAAEQQTEVANYVFQTWNPGYQLTHDCLKDGLLQKTGVFKWWWETQTKPVTDNLTVDPGQLQELLQDPETDVTNATNLGEFYQVTVRRKKEVGRICIAVVPPEEFLISPGSTGQYADTSPMVGHKTVKSYSELVDMGVPKDVLARASGAYEDEAFDLEKVARQNRNTNTMGMFEDSSDPSQKKFMYYELYMLVDFDGDGIAERRKVCLVNKTELVHNDPEEEVPMAWWSPKIMPHEPIGMAVADDLRELQFVRTTLLRQALDNLYLTNNPRTYVNEDSEVNISDLLTVRPGGVVRGKGVPGDSIFPLTVPFVAESAFQMLEYMSQEGEQRSGVSRYFQGLDPNTLNKTATGVNVLTNMAQARVELYARNFAEFAFKPMFKGIQYLLGKYQTDALTVRLRNSVVPVDPMVWQTDYDMTCNVGLGTGNKDQQLMHLQALSQDVAAVAQSPYGRVLIGPDNVFNLFKKKSELAGFKDATKFMKDPASIPPQVMQQMMQPPPDPTMAKAQLQVQADQAKAQAQMQLDSQHHQQEMQVQQAQQAAKMQADVMGEKAKLEANAQTAQLKAHYDAMVQGLQAHLEQQTQILIAKLNNEAKIIAAQIAATKSDPASGAADSGFQRDIQ